jgi:hyaluronoglucosaminidase
MKKTGVVEGFFGPQWQQADRKSYAEFLSRYGGDFYIYAPKQDPRLRKEWRKSWDQNYQSMLLDLVSTFHSAGIKFGVGFSPFGLGTSLTDDDKEALSEKLEILNKLGVDILGLFFDDMPVTANLAETQIETLNIVQKSFKQHIVFCPSYYTPDPILDKVFGQRPENYLNEIAEGVPQGVSIAWTGPKVISPVIDEAHLIEVSSLLKRKPFIWENLFANDGPRNCKFLKLRPFTGRDENAFAQTEAFGFNLMNQAQLSKIVYLASKFVLEGHESDTSFERALSELCSLDFKNFLLINRERFLSIGLDKMTADEKQVLINQLKNMNDQGAVEVKDWLEDSYLVGSECLTD